MKQLSQYCAFARCAEEQGLFLANAATPYARDTVTTNAPESDVFHQRLRASLLRVLNQSKSTCALIILSR